MASHVQGNFTERVDLKVNWKAMPRLTFHVFLRLSCLYSSLCTVQHRCYRCAREAGKEVRGQQ